MNRWGYLMSGSYRRLLRNMRKMSELEREKFDRWAAKAPVNHEGAQRIAFGLWREIRPCLTVAERFQVMSALGHAVDIPNSDRTEFDRVCADIRKRLWPDRA